MERVDEALDRNIDQKLELLTKQRELFDKNFPLIEQFTKKKVKLDVGGKIFRYDIFRGLSLVVSRSTLCSKRSPFSL
jgi:hypothetical protein